jgi:hypothetical protein
LWVNDARENDEHLPYIISHLSFVIEETVEQAALLTVRHLTLSLALNREYQ